MSRLNARLRHKRRRRFSWPIGGGGNRLVGPLTLLEALEARFCCAITVTSTADSGVGTLRQAILDANASPGADTITFAISVLGFARAITLSTPLPAITGTLTIDGYGQGGPGYAGPPLIRIDSNGGPNTNAIGLFFQNVGNNVVQGLSITRWGTGIMFDNSAGGVGNNTLTGTYIGISTDGKSPVGNAQVGLWLSHSNNNTISNNLISVNGLGVALQPQPGIYGDTSSNNTFTGNRIGTDTNGTAKLGNGGAGIYLFNGQNNRVGTNGDGLNDSTEGNVISGNAFEGLVFNGGGGSNVVAGNVIGLNAPGTAALGNGSFGVAFYTAGPNNRIGTNADGTSDALERNVIGGNANTGIYVDTGSGNVIAGNYVGTDVTGKLSRTNAGGIYLNNATNNRIGTNGDNLNDAAERNVISGNAGDGIDFNGGGTNVVAGNFIGLDVSGTAVLANTANGIAFFGNSAGNRIGQNAADANPTAERNVISGNAFAGVNLGQATSNKIVGNYVGVDVTGAIAKGNSSQGIALFSGAVNNQITQNVISGNGFSGVELIGTNVTGNVIQGNFIGTDGAGTAKLANSGDGVILHGGASNNLIGSNFDGVGDSAERNVISGNTFAGVEIDDAGTTQNKVAGNYVGVGVNGKQALGNGLQGVLIAFLASANTVDRNVIAANSPANTYPGLEIYGSATANVVIGNSIGVDATGTNALGNGGGAVLLHFGAANNRIGTNGDGVNDAAEANVIATSANGFAGVEIGDPNTNNNVVAGNKIGVDASGTRPMPNRGPGVFIRNGASNNQIGGPTAVFGNVIANNGSNYTDLGGYHYNDAPGVVITDANSLNNSIRANSIFNNRGLGIDLSTNGFDGVNVNHTTNVAVGPNRLQNYPVILAATPGTASTAVTGLLTGVPNTNYVVDLYASAAPNPSLFGDGQRYLGAATVNTGATGTVTFNVSVAAASAAAEFITATATDPSGNTSEFSAARKLNATTQSPPSSSQWTPIGPSPISAFGDGVITGGRVADVVPDPSNTNVVYLASDTGGVWKTTDWGDAHPVWVPLTDAQDGGDQGLGYHTLAIAPSNPQILYNAVSGPHGGILKSINGGATWTMLAAAQFPQTTFSSIIVNPTDPNTVYVGVRQNFAVAGGVYKSTDGGANWSNVTAATTAADASDVVFDPNNSQTLYAGLVGNIASAGAYKSTNAGSTWVKLGTGLLASANVGPAIRLAVAPSDSQVLYATELDASDNVTRYTSTNGGSTWTLLSNLPTPNDNRYWHVVLAVDPTNAQTVYANADHQLYRSTNGGVTWPVNPFGEDPVNVRFEPTTNAVIITGDRGVYRWNGGVGPVVNKQGNLQNTQNYTITLDPNDERTVYAISQDQGLIQKYSGGSIWNVTTSGDEVGRVLVNPTNSSRIFAFAAAAVENSPLGAVIRSDDGGATWVGKASGLPGALAAFPQSYTIQKSFVMDPANPHRLLVGFQGVYESTDDADSWHAISPTNGLSAGRFVTSIAIAPSAPNTIYAATDDGRLFSTTNNGSAWLERDTNLPIDPFNRVIDLKVDPANAQRVFAVTGADRFGADGPHVWMTSNGGATWTDISSNLDPIVWAQSLAVDWRFANPVLYLGTARGVQTSTVTGTSTTWNTFATGLPNVPVQDLQLLPNSNLLAAGTYGRGVWEIRVGTPAIFNVAGGNHAFLIARDPDGVNADVTVDAGPVQKVLISQLSELIVGGGVANDTLTLDFSNGNPLPAGGITFVGDAGADALVIIGTGGNDVLTAGPAGLTFSGGSFANVPIHLVNVSSLKMHGGAGQGSDTINLASGAWQIDADTPSGAPSVSVNVQAGAMAAFAGDQHLANLTIADASAQLVAPSRRTISVAGAFSLTGNGTLDLGGGNLIVTGTAAGLTALVKKAAGTVRGSGLNAWDGAGGITSNLARTDAAANNLNQYAVGVVDAGDNALTGFGLAAGQVSVRFAVYGDANLDNNVDIADLSIWNNNFGAGNHTGTGDFNYDGTVDIADLSIWNNAFGASTPAAPVASVPVSSAPVASASVASASVPSPPVAAVPVAAEPVAGPITTPGPASPPALTPLPVALVTHERQLPAPPLVMKVAPVAQVYVLSLKAPAPHRRLKTSRRPTAKAPAEVVRRAPDWPFAKTAAKPKARSGPLDWLHAAP